MLYRSRNIEKYRFGGHFGRHLEYLKMLKGAPRAPIRFLIGTFKLTNFNHKTLSLQIFTVSPAFYWTNIMRITITSVIKIDITVIAQ